MMLKNQQHYFGQSESVVYYIYFFKEKPHNLGPILKRSMSLFKYKPMRNPIKVNNIFKMRHVSGHMLGA